MQNYYIASARDGYRIPELWHMFARNGNIFFTFTALCIEKLQGLEIKKEFGFALPSSETKWGADAGFQPLRKRKNGTYILVIPVSDQTEKVLRNAIAKSLSLLTHFLNVFVIPGLAETKEVVENSRIQLFSLETYHNGGYHGSALEVTISPEGALFLNDHSNQRIPGVHREMRAHAFALYPQEKKRDPIFLQMDLVGVIREYGTISFKTPGNCACLGDAPEPIREGRGLYATSHNLDTPSQQLSMLVGIATMWYWVRRSLKYK